MKYFIMIIATLALSACTTTGNNTNVDLNYVEIDLSAPPLPAPVCKVADTKSGYADGCLRQVEVYNKYLIRYIAAAYDSPYIKSSASDSCTKPPFVLPDLDPAPTIKQDVTNMTNDELSVVLLDYSKALNRYNVNMLNDIKDAVTKYNKSCE